MIRLPLTALLIAIPISVSPSLGLAQDYRTIAFGRRLSDETSLTADLRFVAGKVSLSRDPMGSLFRASLVYDREKFEVEHGYDSESAVLSVEMNGKVSDLELEDLERSEQRMDLTLTDMIPLSLQVSLGVGTAHIDLGGLRLENAHIKSAASRSLVTFSQPTLMDCERLVLEVAAAEFDVTRLGNARCSEVQFKAGAGEFTLDFTGAWTEGMETKAEIDFGLAELTLRLPRGLGVSVDLENRFLASFEKAGFERRAGVFYTSDYDEATSKLVIDASAFLGEINVEWVSD